LRNVLSENFDLKRRQLELSGLAFSSLCIPPENQFARKNLRAGGPDAVVALRLASVSSAAMRQLILLPQIYLYVF
jgi:hypothetical protein